MPGDYRRNSTPLRKHLGQSRYGDPRLEPETVRTSQRVHRSISGLEKAVIRNSRAFLGSGATGSVWESLSIGVL